MIIKTRQEKTEAHQHAKKNAAECRRLLALLAAKIDSLDSRAPATLRDWGVPGTLAHYAEVLRDLVDPQ